MSSSGASGATGKRPALTQPSPGSASKRMRPQGKNTPEEWIEYLTMRKRDWETVRRRVVDLEEKILGMGSDDAGRRETNKERIKTKSIEKSLRCRVRNNFEKGLSELKGLGDEGSASLQTKIESLNTFYYEKLATMHSQIVRDAHKEKAERNALNLESRLERFNRKLELFTGYINKAPTKRAERAKLHASLYKAKEAKGELIDVCDKLVAKAESDNNTAEKNRVVEIKQDAIRRFEAQHSRNKSKAPNTTKQDKTGEPMEPNNIRQKIEHLWKMHEKEAKRYEEALRDPNSALPGEHEKGQHLKRTERQNAEYASNKATRDYWSFVYDMEHQFRTFADAETDKAKEEELRSFIADHVKRAYDLKASREQAAKERSRAIETNAKYARVRGKIQRLMEMLDEVDVKKRDMIALYRLSQDRKGNELTEIEMASLSDLEKERMRLSRIVSRRLKYNKTKGDLDMNNEMTMNESRRVNTTGIDSLPKGLQEREIKRMPEGEGMDGSEVDDDEGHNEVDSVDESDEEDCTDSDESDEDEDYYESDEEFGESE
jgi:hypothetical protein